jgi:hypothetical protein
MARKVQARGLCERDKLHPALETTTSQNLTLYFLNYFFSQNFVPCLTKRHIMW